MQLAMSVFSNRSVSFAWPTFSGSAPPAYFVQDEQRQAVADPLTQLPDLRQQLVPNQTLPRFGPLVAHRLALSLSLRISLAVPSPRMPSETPST